MPQDTPIFPPSDTPNIGINRLPGKQRHEAAAKKYEEAVKLYAATNLPLNKVALLTGVTPTGLSSYLSSHHRELLLNRYGITHLLTPEGDAQTSGEIKVKSTKGQSQKTFLKYKAAIEACADSEYIELNLSEIARLFNLNPTALSSQLKYHYPEILSEREKRRQSLGIADNKQHGPRRESIETYEDAARMYRDTDLTLEQVSEKCNVPHRGLSQFLRFYHKDIIEAKAKRRKESKRSPREKRAGELAANGTHYGPSQETIARYEDALHLYTTTPLTIESIAENTGVPVGGFSGYLKTWQREEIAKKQEEARQKGGRLSTAAKYEAAIEKLRKEPAAVAKIADEFGLNPNVFRQYLKEHEPELHARQGMELRDDGKRIKRTSQEKYRAAIEEYATTPTPMKEIAERHGLVYKSLMSFLKRNHPEAIARHQALN